MRRQIFCAAVWHAKTGFSFGQLACVVVLTHTWVGTKQKSYYERILWKYMLFVFFVYLERRIFCLLEHKSVFLLCGSVNTVPEHFKSRFLREGCHKPFLLFQAAAWTLFLNMVTAIFARRLPQTKGSVNTVPEHGNSDICEKVATNQGQREHCSWTWQQRYLREGCQ